MAKAKASLIWKGAREKAEALLAAISPDDPGDFESKLAGEGDSVELRITVESDEFGKSRGTVDDILACLAAAESGFDSIE